MPCTLSQFQILRPQYESSQQDTLEWVAAAHTKADAIHNKKEECPTFHAAFSEKLFHVGCKPGTIATRGHVIDDFHHRQWNAMNVYRLEESASGMGMQQRSEIYKGVVDDIFEQFYPEGSAFPDDIIHVSCTGYISPSGAQHVISKRGATNHVTATHAYHMGCYAALPAIRMASGFVSGGDTVADIVHTELCSLHTNPLLHELDQLVAQSLFADGFIKYRVAPAQIPIQEPHLQVLAVYEQIIPSSLKAMTWGLTEWGFKFYLSREIPVLIIRHLKDYLSTLCKKAKVDEKEMIENALFAIHPGGPKILNYAQDLFGISNEQIAHSRKALECYGNMSSATLPHIWSAICVDENIPAGTPVISLAFGPGLTIAGALLRKEG